MKDKEKIYLLVLEDYKGIIYKVANTYCFDQSDRDDLIQEITIQIWTSIERYSGQYKWSTWIYRIALNTSISFYRKNKRRKDKTVDFNPIVEIAGMDQQNQEDENLQLLRKFIKELKEIDRALILLHLEGLESKEIAGILNTSQTNVTTKTSRIKKKLKQKFIDFKNK
ncbi:RNA polymerase subunit sigma-70 [Nonlabens spongiae]|uniref:RNA polymerase subunit sigma-70 n=1 Tax=Nonlabens spongiae TaxID=331648 RepID=A0A1W6MJ01_9FLAO|nr:RNA polymerase sigma factor [Nonlabens spongiae]ARN77563.1 RNA polymerase subunit sigma-70 [Nonlabens spongiae]